MPCFKQEKSIDCRPRRDKYNDRDPMAPKAVRPRAMQHHGLFGMSIATQHLIVEEKWSPNSLTEQFIKLSDFLRTRVIYKRLETQANHRSLCTKSQRIKSQCTDGRIKLQKVTAGNNAHKIRNFLINHKDMQRLYQRMPIHLVVDNINQRTFTMRKERDRLEFRLSQMKNKYKSLLLDCSKVHNRIKYENEFVLEEEIKSRILLKKIENSNVRLKAVKTINNTYKKMVQVLMQDEIFYEPILRSLDGDIEDQSNFIKHILYLGTPAISRFKQISKEFEELNVNSRKNTLAKIASFASLQKPLATGPPVVKVKTISTVDPKRYVRETQSMKALQNQLHVIESTIKRLKLLTLCSQAREIYPNVKGHMENNKLLHRKINFDCMHHEMLRKKMIYSSVTQSLLINNLSSAEINRLERIDHLRKVIRENYDFAQETMEYIKNRGDAFVSIRFSLWNLNDILRHVDRNPRKFNYNYPNSYLKLPLLKFDMLDICAAPPDFYEEDIEKIMHILKRKVHKLMKSYKANIKAQTMKRCREKYHADYMASLMSGGSQVTKHSIRYFEDGVDEEKVCVNIPDRKNIKAQSTKVIDEALRLLDL